MEPTEQTIRHLLDSNCSKRYHREKPPVKHNMLLLKNIIYLSPERHPVTEIQGIGKRPGKLPEVSGKNQDG
jgi:hypothetical protein